MVSSSRRYPACVGCGYCCLAFTCSLGVINSGCKMGERCPFLHWSEERGRYLCNLYLDRLDLEEDLAIGVGCSISLNSWRREVKYRG